MIKLYLTKHLKTLQLLILLFSHENQAISLQGKIKDRTNKDLS
jgi:hypothetical protein